MWLKCSVSIDFLTLCHCIKLRPSNLPKMETVNKKLISQSKKEMRNFIQAKLVIITQKQLSENSENCPTH